MSKKQLTEAQKQELRDRLAKARAIKAQKQTQPPEQQTAAPVEHPPAGSDTTINQEDYNALLKHVMELQSLVLNQNQGPATGPQFNHRGSLIGTVEKYLVDPANYPDPRERLANEPQLQRFAFKDNYELDWNISVTSYETKDGINTKEPKFTIELRRIVFDDATGTPTDGRYVVCRAIFHEDPQAALVIARDNGVDVDEAHELAFLNEMRYLRLRDWLLEAFYPPKPAQEKQNKKEVVIGGKLVEYFEINSTNSETIPFGNLKSKF